MATLKELLKEIDDHEKTIFKTVIEDSKHRVRVHVEYETGDGIGESLARDILIRNRGSDIEKAFWDHAKPAYLVGEETQAPEVDMRVAEMKEAVRVYMKSVPKVHAYVVEETHPDEKFAVVKAYVKTWRGVCAKNYIVFKTKDGWVARETR